MVLAAIAGFLVLAQHQYDGRLGDSRIGLTIVLNGDKIEGGHYFYQKYLQDIALTGEFADSQLALKESGGVFHLHFVGNGSDGGKPLDFENSIGMDGTWTSADGSRTYPVSLHGTLVRDVSDGPRYGDITTESDAAFEKRVQAWYRAVLSGDKATAARLTSYPLRVNLGPGRTRNYRNAAELLAAWNTVFTPALIAQLRDDLPHDMFVHNGAAMLGNGEAWFDHKGLTAVNPPAVHTP